MSAPVLGTIGVDDADLTARFGPVYARIAEGAVDRERDRRLPFEQVQWLREAGWGRLRVPAAYGGLGATYPQLAEQLAELARADSNLPQLLRGHVGFVESRLVHPDLQVRDRWLRRIGAGDLAGNAQSEQHSHSFFGNATTLRRGSVGWRLTGGKFYSTGSLFADWIVTTASVDGDPGRSANLVVRADAPGVVRTDDWDGFGQRLTGSGTTTFTDVEVDGDDVEVFENGDYRGTALLSVFQLNHLATLAGIGRAALADVTTFVRARTRNLANPAVPPPLDPLVQGVVGQIAGASYAADAIVRAAAERIGEVLDRQVVEVVPQADLDALDGYVFAVQGLVVDLVLDLATRIFEVGGSSAVREGLALDRHWRNARTLASHNPVVHRQRIVGDYVLNGTSPISDLRKGVA